MLNFVSSYFHINFLEGGQYQEEFQSVLEPRADESFDLSHDRGDAWQLAEGKECDWWILQNTLTSTLTLSERNARSVEEVSFLSESGEPEFLQPEFEPEGFEPPAAVAALEALEVQTERV